MNGDQAADFAMILTVAFCVIAVGGAVIDWLRGEE
jgi:hypothetical protein